MSILDMPATGQARTGDAVATPLHFPQHEHYEAFVRRHWARHPKDGPMPGPRILKAVTQFANISSAVTVVLSQRPADSDLFIACSGLIGETGNAVWLLKEQAQYADGRVHRSTIRDALGMVLFYLTRIAQFEDGPDQLVEMAHKAFFEVLAALDFTFAEVAKANVEKLEARYGSVS